MDKKTKYRTTHRRCRFCKYFYYKRLFIGCRALPWCDLKEKFLSDRTFTDNIQGCFCRWYELRKEE